MAQTPVATPVGDQIALYAAARDALIDTGRVFVGDFLAGNDEAFASALTPELRDLLGERTASGYLEMLETNRVEMAFPEAAAWFNGHFDGTTTMEGLFYQGMAAGFTLEAETPQEGEVPTGRWTGAIAPGTLDLGIEITFEGHARDLSATLSIPDQGLIDHPLSNVRFHPTVTIGPLRQEEALPFARSINAYRAEYAWGDALLVITANEAEPGVFNGFSFAATLPLPSDPAARIGQDVVGRLPPDGQMIVFWGGDTTFQNYHASTPPQRHAYDIVVWRNGATYRTTGADATDYHIRGRPVVAPVAGTVVALENGLPDIAPVGGALPTDAPVNLANPAGNHVVIETGAGAYLFLAHLQRGSVSVSVGDALEPGDAVGLVGNSGNTSEPHIHIHAQTTPDLRDPAAIGLPLAFRDVLIDGEPVGQAAPVQGQFVEHQEES